MTNLEIELTSIMVKLIVRYPDGLERIQAAFESVLIAGEEMGEED
jgi:hypothetical protein